VKTLHTKFIRLHPILWPSHLLTAGCSTLNWFLQHSSALDHVGSVS
jgi:hypothetical protein